MSIPTYSDGKPTNLQAAIVDAMYWLRVLRHRLYDDPQLPLTERREHQAYLRLAIQALEEFLPPDDDSGNASAPPPRDNRRGGTIKARYCKVCSCELDEFNLAKQGDHICRKCKEAEQQAKANLIKEKLRARQRALMEAKG